MKPALFCALIMMLVLFACAPANTTRTPSAIIPSSTGIPMTLAPTDTVALTATPEPTVTPTVTPLPDYQIVPMGVPHLKLEHVLGYGQPFDVRYSPDGKRLALLTSEKTCFLDAQTLQEQTCLQISSDRAHTIWRATNILSDDFTRLLVATRESVSLWETASGNRITEVTPEGESKRGYELIKGMGISADGLFFATQTTAGVQLYNSRGKLLAQFPGEAIGIGNRQPFSPDGVSLVTSKDNLLSIRSTEDGSLVKQVIGESNFYGSTFSSDGRFLIGLNSGTINVYTMGDFKRVWFYQPPGGAGSFAFSANGKRLALAAGKGSIITLWNTDDWKLVQTLDAPEVKSYAKVIISADGNRVTAVTDPWDSSTCRPNQGATVYAWDAGQSQPVSERAVFPGCSSESVLAISPDGARLVYAGGLRFSQIVSQDTVSAEIMAVLPVGLGAAAAFSGNSDWLASSDGNSEVFLWNARTWELEDQLSLSEAALASPNTYNSGVGVSNDGQRLVMGTASGHVLYYDRAAGSEPQVLYEGEQNARKVAISPDGDLVAYATDNGIELWSISRQALVELADPGERVNTVMALSFSPDGQYLLAGVFLDRGFVNLLWNILQPGSEPKRLQGFPKAVAISTNNQFFASGMDPSKGDDYPLTTYSLPVGNPYVTVIAKGNDLTGIAISADGNVLAAAMESGSYEQMRIEFFDMWKGEHVYTLRVNGNEGDLFDNVLLFSPDNLTVVVGAGAGHALNIYRIRD